MADTTAVLIEPGGTDEATLTRLGGAFLASFSSPHTRRGYRIDLRDWFAWCRGYQVDPLNCRRQPVDLWMRHLEAAGLAAATRSRKLAVIRSFYYWCIDEEFVAANPASRVKRPPEEHRPQPAYSRTQMARLLEAAEAAGGYDHALVMLLFVNGLRVSEACGADVADLGEDRWHRTLTIRGKGAKVETIPLPPPVVMALHTALDGREVGPLLLNRYGSRANRNSAVRTLTRLAKAAGIPRVPPHALRRTGIQLQIDDRTSLRDVQLWARHADPSTTAMYDHKLRSMDDHPAYGVMRSVS